MKEVYESLLERMDKPAAQAIIADAVRRSAVKQAAEFAAREPDGTSLATFVDIQRHWTAEDALTVEVIHRDGQRFDFNVTRCRYAEMYRQMGLGEIGPLLSCNRDGAFCEGYDPRLTLTRTQTLMEGASHCDFRYTYTPDTPDAPAEPTG